MCASFALNCHLCVYARGLFCPRSRRAPPVPRHQEPATVSSSCLTLSSARACGCGQNTNMMRRPRGKERGLRVLCAVGSQSRAGESTQDSCGVLPRESCWSHASGLMAPQAGEGLSQKGGVMSQGGRSSERVRKSLDEGGLGQGDAVRGSAMLRQVRGPLPILVPTVPLAGQRPSSKPWNSAKASL